MCGVVGVVEGGEAGITLYDSLIMLQHRGQDAAGIMTEKNQKIFQRRRVGLINQVFRENRHFKNLEGSMGVAHTRYPTSGGYDRTQVQPFYVNSPCGIGLAHNGNLTNSAQLRESIEHFGHRHLNTNSDSEVLLNVFANALEKHVGETITKEAVFQAVTDVQNCCQGAYSVVLLIVGFGVVGFRDPYGVRPLCYGERTNPDGKTDYMIASESISLDVSGFTLKGDIPCGSAMIVTKDRHMHQQTSVSCGEMRPCLFEYVYLSRPDSIINKVSVFQARHNMGRKLGEQINTSWPDHDIDLVIGVPDTSRVAASELARTINRPYSEALIKNRYVGRTFIMAGQKQRQRSIKRKLNMVASEVEGKNILLVDDSIVRGNTAREIVRMARNSGAKRVYLASAAPPVSYPNIYGIDMPSAKELLTAMRTNEESCEYIGCDRLIYQTLEDLESSVRELNPELVHFENSVFTGHYLPSENLQDEYFVQLEQERSKADLDTQVKTAV